MGGELAPCAQSVNIARGVVVFVECVDWIIILTFQKTSPTAPHKNNNNRQWKLGPELDTEFREPVTRQQRGPWPIPGGADVGLGPPGKCEKPRSDRGAQSE